MTDQIPSQSFFLEKWIPNLPQYEHIKKDNAKEWYNAVVEVEPERFAWHFERLKGLGGSDIGEIVAWKLDIPNLFKNPIDIVKSRLMVTHPEPSNNDMRRGTLLEPVIRNIFYEDFEAEPDKKSIDSINNFTSDKYPWMKGNVDDVVLIDNTRFIVDYKAPSHKVGKTTGIQYASQLHQYNFILGVSKGFQNNEPGADSMLLVPFKYEDGVTTPIEVFYDPVIIKAMLEGGTEIWEHILHGTYPNLKKAVLPEIEYSEVEQNNIEILEENFMRYKLLSDAIDTRFKRSKQQLISALTKNFSVPLKKHKNPMEILSLTIRETVNNKALEKIIFDSQIDRSQFLQPGKKYDVDRMLDDLELLGKNVNDYLKQDWDIEKIKDYCQNNNIKVPISEMISPTLRPKPKQNFGKPEILNAKMSADKLITQIRDQIEIGSERDTGLIEDDNIKLKMVS